MHPRLLTRTGTICVVWCMLDVSEEIDVSLLRIKTDPHVPLFSLVKAVVGEVFATVFAWVTFK